ncbi:hypothetical protein SARC_05260 [Sphaeroforma arctica JP610]|uniref:Oxo-4-hydroxy-4-carboxy-5-ureidoimidazoline decarboxylase domain-containing protein n=1 Tax=Sphaeroforma arctica JP610 TaxID=667725 RepID=A0A0L0G2P0_9EUKA|nr:hypothetical protein SARC_05260 [Sphaeroforma arctica JP610]KNC82468.1 hypothetical protein SARC_05260 [Sphaeroforma arctica JP610]|eukprot:XP_014156370.1 hypothetical protein SARC_05260 [Sphaeroforma arctica JP610]
MNTADYENQVKILAAHPMIGQTKNLSAHSAKEQGSGDGTPAEVIELLAVLNKEYQDKFGFCFVVFVNGRPKKDIIPVLESRLGNTKEEECKEGLKAMVLIAEDRFKKMNVA